MGFTVPNDGTAGDRQQEELHESDLLILAAGHNGYGVVSGCAVSAQGTPDMTVAVASGTAKVGGTNVTVSAGNVTITADGSNPRYVLIEVDSAGAKSANAGTAAANPTKPTPSSTKTVLAEVYVPAGDTAIGAAQIVDKRVLLGASSPLPWIVEIDTYLPAAANTNFDNVLISTAKYRNAIKYSSGAQNAEMSWPVVLAAGTWVCQVVADRETAYGIASIQIDDVEKGTIDFYGVAANSLRFATSGFAIAADGEYTLKLKITSKNASSSGYQAQISALRLIRTA